MPNHDDYIDYGSAGQPMYWAAYLLETWRTSRVQNVFACIGTVLAVWYLAKLALFFWPFIRPSKIPIYCHSVTGSWALVTGATDGIGFGFAEELLDRGFNVLLHGRNPEKLERVKAQLAEKYPRRQLDTVVADASRFDDGGPELVAEKARNLPGKLTVLVNNVGGAPHSTKFPSYFEMSGDAHDAIINLNARFPTRLIRALAPSLKDNTPSLIINCGSSSGEIGVPYIVTYSGTKAYLHALSRSLKAEFYADGLTGIDVLGILIGNTASAGNKGYIPFWTISSRECAKGSLNRVGGSAALEFCHWKHAVHTTIASWVPETYIRKQVANEMRGRKERENKTE